MCEAVIVVHGPCHRNTVSVRQHPLKDATADTALLFQLTWLQVRHSAG